MDGLLALSSRPSSSPPESGRAGMSDVSSFCMSCRIKSRLFDNLAISAAWRRCVVARDPKSCSISREPPRVILRGDSLRVRRGGGRVWAGGTRKGQGRRGGDVQTKARSTHLDTRLLLPDAARLAENLGVQVLAGVCPRFPGISRPYILAVACERESKSGGDRM